MSADRIIFSLYVVNMIINNDDYDYIKSLKLDLAHCLAMKDLHLMCYFSGIKVVQSKKRLYSISRKSINLIGLNVYDSLIIKLLIRLFKPMLDVLRLMVLLYQIQTYIMLLCLVWII